MPSRTRFWSRFAARYDGHLLSREAATLSPRTARAVGAAERALDAGCGTGQVTVELARLAKQVDAVDFVDEMLAIARGKTEALGITNVTFGRSGVESLPFPAATFDAVVLSNVLHLVDDPPAVLSEARRVLRAGGKLVAPTYCHAEGLRTLLLSHVTALLFSLPIASRFGAARLLGMVESAGFRVEAREVVRLKIPLVFVEASAV
jgi:phosphatidylethanolamine/phosphatidyl-N-methylethanolamine N-methyltransferase